MYTVSEDAGGVELTAIVRGKSVIDNAVIVFTSTDNATAQGSKNILHCSR